MSVRRILEGVREKHLEATIIFVDFTKAFDSKNRGKMEEIILADVLPPKTLAAIMILYKNTKVNVRSPEGDTDYFDIVASELQGDTLDPYYVLRTSIDLMKENGFKLRKKNAEYTPHKQLQTRITLMT